MLKKALLMVFNIYKTGVIAMGNNPENNKSKKHNPIIILVYVAVVALVVSGAFIGYNVYRRVGAKTRISEAITDAKQFAIKREFDKAKKRLDVIIAEYAFDNLELVKDAEKQRERIIEQHGKWVSGKAEYQRQAEAAKLIMEEAKRKRKLHNILRDADRFWRKENTCRRAVVLIEQAYQLCQDDAERARVAIIEKQVKAALINVLPWTAVVDFTLDRSVKVDLTGSSIAIKLEQALGCRYRLVTRSQVSKALKELRFQNSDLANRSNAEKFGQMLGAEYLITGSVVQIGDEITLACQRFSIETGAIRQTAEVSTFSVDDFNYVIRESAMILCMSAVEKQQYIDEKFNYPKHIKAGKKAFIANNFADAVHYFKRAKGAKRTKEVDALLKSAEAKAEEQRILKERKFKCRLAISHGNKLLREHKWHQAQTVFKEALKIPGYEHHKSLLRGIKIASNGKDIVKPDKFINRGKNITIFVPNDIKTINTAMYMAKAGDTVYVEPGDYLETIIFKEGVILRGRDKKRCRILPTSAATAVIIALNCRSGSIQNLTIDGSGQYSEIIYGVGIKTKRVANDYIDKYIFSGTEPDSSGIDIPDGAELLTVNGYPYIFWPYIIALQGKDKKIRIEYRFNNNIKSITIKPCRTKGEGTWPDGIAILNSSIEVKDCIVSNLNGSGILATGNNSKLIAKNNICSSTFCGIFVNTGAYAKVSNNLCNKNANSDIVFSQKATGEIIKNTCNKNSAYGICVNAKSNAKVEDNQCHENFCGITLALEATGEITKNICNKNVDTGILVDIKSTAEVKGNQCSKTKAGIIFRGDSTGRIAKNICSLNTYGIFVTTKLNVDVEENQCNKNTGAGIGFEDGATGRIAKNICSLNSCGIFVTTKLNVDVEENQCNKNIGIGIGFEDGATGKVINNTCHQNQFGIIHDKHKMAVLIRSNSIIDSEVSK
jgi:parallel beta-helix repeat protein